MIFYSGQQPTTLRQLLCDQHIDGVFIVPRTSFFDDVQPIVEDHIKKISDINNVRGVVMSATSSMDSDLRDVLVTKLKSLNPTDSNSALVKLQTRLTEFHEKKIKAINALNNALDGFSNQHLTNFENIRVGLKDQLSKEPELKALIENESIVHKVQMERNTLAHQKVEFTDDGQMFLQGGKEPIVYDFKDFIRLRKELLIAKKNISKLKN